MPLRVVEGSFCFNPVEQRAVSDSNDTQVRVMSTATGKSKTVWQHSGNSGDAWFETAVQIGAQNMFQIVFSATVRNSVGDIAIDDISFIDCSPGNFYGPADCSFESDFCNYLNQQHEV